MKRTAWIVGARIASGLSGYLILAVAANHLTAAQFATLSTLQTCIFLSHVFFDSGITQLAIKETAGSRAWRELVEKYQNIRLTIHIVLAIGILLAQWSGLLPSSGAWMTCATAMVMFSNALVVDWVLFSQDDKSQWAAKALVTSGVNIVITVTLLVTLSHAGAVLLGVALSNTAGWLYLRNKYQRASFTLTLPKWTEIRHSSQLALGTALFHTAYNTPLLLVTYFADNKISAMFALLYRLFSASTLFIPTLVEFAAAKELTKLKNHQGKGHLEVFSRLVFQSLLVCSPMLLLPNHLIYEILSAAIDLDKFLVKQNDLDYVKVALLLYCADFCSQRTAFIFDQKKLLVAGGAFGLLVAGAVLATELTSHSSPGSFNWFHPLFAYQASSMSLVLVTMSVIRHRRDR